MVTYFASIFSQYGYIELKLFLDISKETIEVKKVMDLIKL